MSYAPFKSWLQQTMGLDPSTIAPLAVERAVQSRITACGMPDLVAYSHLLSGSRMEQQNLVECLVIRETYFFRDREAFTGLARVFDAEWLRGQPAGLRLLSVPCASGEEAYSMAMALLDAGFPGEHLHIDAMDISQTALNTAQQGVYGSHSFRGTDLAFRARHFEQAGQKWQLSDAIRASVRFAWGNVLTLDSENAAADYHAIFCRNLLIYFDEATQVRTVTALSELLREDGLLFVGPSETGLLLTMGFVPAQLPMAFAFRKPAATAVRRPPGSRQGHVAEVPARTLPKPTFQVPREVGPIRKPVRPGLPGSTDRKDAPDLDAAERLADSGRLEESSAMCTAHLQACGPTARSMYLLGLVQGAGGDERCAEGYFRKALYLQPDHMQALSHLALLLDARGDLAGARRLRDRSSRKRGVAS